MRGDDQLLAANRSFGVDHFDSRLAMLSRRQRGIRLDWIDRAEKRSWAQPEQGIDQAVAARSRALPEHRHQRAPRIPPVNGSRARHTPGPGAPARSARDGLAATAARESNTAGPQTQARIGFEASQRTPHSSR